MRGDSRRRWWRAAVASTATGIVLAASAGTAHAATRAEESSSPEVTVSIDPAQPWTQTGVTVEAGDSVNVAASGLVHLGAPPIDAMAPAGLPWGPQCTAIGGEGGWPAPGLSCYSLLGRIGSGQPFAIGSGGTIKVDAAGELALGTNDNNFTDNSGAWSAVVTPAASAPSGASTDTQNATGGGSLAIVALVGGVVLAALAALFLFLRKRAAREPVFDLSDTLRVGRIDVRITRDGTVWRIDRTGEQQQFVPFASDFGLVGTAGQHGTFSWRGLQFRAVRSHGRFGRGHGEARMPGQYAAASAGMILDPGGYTEGVLPLSLPGAWVFTLVSVDTETDSDENTHRASANGHLTMFIRDDQPFRPQADELVASFRAFLDDLDRLLAEREAKSTTAGRTEVAAAVE